ncbi:uncharacterized protein LOC122257321 [Penaeus japonicus]|uniref:uncharacterized protein LOC122257321 n=1 Tax=Penaeus japonicus TaxID=27405 RepID=UPI001C70C4AD|nr:uncharacterized protein LOC122257321 [Penaeus japonicus]
MNQQSGLSKGEMLSLQRRLEQRGADATVLQDPKNVAEWWKEYLQELFYDNREEEDMILETAVTDPRILKDEVRWTLKAMKTGKAARQDEVPVEMLVALGEEGVDLVWSVTNKYEFGTQPEEMLKSVFVALPKNSWCTCLQ